MPFWDFLCCKESQKKVSIKRKSRISSKRLSVDETKMQKLDDSYPVSDVTTMKAKVSDPEKKIERKNLYEGEELNGIPHGTGTMLYVNGDYYRGEWVSGLKEGRGIQNNFEENTRYEGEWKKNLPNGEGKFTQSNGSYYVGNFKNGKKDGKGQYCDSETKITYEQIYEEGALKQRHEITRKKDKSEEFPTLVLDKQRFNSQDLQKFEEQNPEIQELDIEFLLKYYGLCKIINLPFIETSIVDWNISQVLKFLEEIQLKEHKQIFYENKIKGKDLIGLEESELKQDLKMNLGDRKKLINYIQYLESLNYRPKKVTPKKSSKKRRGSFGNISMRDKWKMSILSVQERISEADNEDECWKQESEKSSIKKVKQKKNIIHKGFDTEGWDHYNSNDKQKIQFCSQNTGEEKLKSKDSNQTIKDTKQQQEYFELPRYQKRKKSEDRHDISNSLTNNSQIIGNQYGAIAKPYQRKQKAKSSKEQDSSISSLDEEMMKLKKKKMSNTTGSHEILQLYEFLKENKSLDFIIKKRDIEIIEQIGVGGYGKVYRGKYMSTPVAVKDYMKAGKNHKNREDFMKQVYILSDLKHPNIVLYMGMCITVNQYQLVTQFLENGSLFDQLHNKKTRFSCDEIFEIIDDIVRGMVYLHSMKNMIHRDLKSSNVLIDEDWKVKLCDFGLSGHKKKKKKKSQKNRVGTYQWMAPQVIRNEEIDFYSDVYSFGVIIWELLTENIPYEGLSEVQITGLVGYDDNHKLPQPPDCCDKFIAELMDKCLERNPANRPTFIQIQKQLDEQRLKRPNMKVDWSSK